MNPWIIADSPRAGPTADSTTCGLLAALSSNGVNPNEVQWIVNSHLEGIGWNTLGTFPAGRYVFPAEELSAVGRGIPIQGSEDLGPLIDAGVLGTIDPPLELTPGITVIDAPGHSYGHIAVRVESESELAVNPGHLILSLAQIDDPDIDLGDTDYAAASPPLGGGFWRNSRPGEACS
ncbi:MAG: hypothetical protein ACLPUG_11165 [Acidimicrobiales bacterium]